LGRRKEPGAKPTEVTGRQDPSPTMMKEGQEGCGGRTEERIPASGVFLQTLEGWVYSSCTWASRWALTLGPYGPLTHTPTLWNNQFYIP